MPAPRTFRISDVRQSQRGRGPETARVPRQSDPGAAAAATTENAVTDLPLPDSPTSPSVSPLRISNDTSSTATTGRPGTSNTVVRLSNRQHRVIHSPAPMHRRHLRHLRQAPPPGIRQTLRAAYQRFRRPSPRLRLPRQSAARDCRLTAPPQRTASSALSTRRVAPRAHRLHTPDLRPLERGIETEDVDAIGLIGHVSG